MSTRPVLLLVALALFVASCGVSREAATEGVDSDVETVEESADAGTDTPDDGTGDDPAGTTPPTTAPAELPPTSPPTTAAGDEIAATLTFDDGGVLELLHGDLNDVVVPTRENAEFVDLVYQGAVPPGFEAAVLSQTVLGEVMDNELAKRGAEATAEDLDEARTLLFQNLEPLLGTFADPTAEAERLYEEVPYLPFIAGLQARQIALSSVLADESDESTGVPCVRHILLEQEAEALDVLTELDGGADFATLAAERSTGPTGPNGGDLGCAPSSGYVTEFAVAVDEAEVGDFIGPVETEFGFHVILVEGYEVNGDELAQQALNDGLLAADVAVDERVGMWDPTRLTIVAAG